MSTRSVIVLVDKAHAHRLALMAPWQSAAQENGLMWEPCLIEDPREAGDAFASNIEPAGVLVWLSQPNDVVIKSLEIIDNLLPPASPILLASYRLQASEAAASLENPGRLIGLSPLGLITGGNNVTLAQTLQSSSKAKADAESLMSSLGTIPAWIKDTPGLVLPRIYAMLANEAAFAVQEQVASPEAIDTAMKLGTNYPMGPLAWADAVGLDDVLATLEGLYATYRDPRYRPCMLLQQKVWAGQLGKASGQGFFTYQTVSPTVI